MIQTYLKSYLTGLSSTIKTVRNVQAMYEPINAYRFNLFNFWYPGENKLSEILAFFLDPIQTHGQGDVFLKAFLKTYDLSRYVSNTVNVSVKCEYAITFQRRIDILLTFYNDNFAIGIENKFGAGDQPNQLHDYAEFLKGKFKKYILFYLTPEGLEPSKQSISKENYIDYNKEGVIQSISYKNNIIDLVHEWSLACRSERVRHFLNDFEQYFKQELLGDTFMDEHQIVTDFALSTQENLAAAFETYKAFGTIKQEVGIRFTNKLTAELKERFNAPEWSVIEYGAFNVVLTNSNWPEQTFIGIRDFDRDRVHFSIKTENIIWQDLYRFVKNEKSGSFNANNWWSNLVPVYNKWDEKLDGITAIYNLSDEAIDYMINGLMQIADVVQRFFKLPKQTY